MRVKSQTTQSKSHMKAGEMSELVKALTAKSDDLNSIPVTYNGRRTNPSKVSSAHTDCDMYALHINKCNKIYIKYNRKIFLVCLYVVLIKSKLRKGRVYFILYFQVTIHY